SLAAAVCSQSSPAYPRVPTPIQPMFTLSLAARPETKAGPAASAAVRKNVRRLSSSAIETSISDDSKPAPAPSLEHRDARTLAYARGSDRAPYLIRAAIARERPS